MVLKFVYSVLIKDWNENNEFINALLIDSCDKKTKLEKFETISGMQLVDTLQKTGKVTFQTVHFISFQTSDLKIYIAIII